MGYRHPEVIAHWPPQFIVARQTAQPSLTQVIMTDKVSIKFQEIECEWQYSNPTGIFNLSCVSKPYKQRMHDRPLYYKKMKEE